MKTMYLAVALAACGAVPGTAAAALAPAGQSYQLSVSASFEAPFKDCWSFSNNGRFVTSRSGLGTFPYQLTGLNSNAGHFQAVWRGGVSIGFSGTTNGPAISGDGVDYRDRTYSFTGTSVASCAANAAPGLGSWRKRD